MSSIDSYSSGIKKLLHSIFKEFGGNYEKFIKVVPIALANKIDLVIFEILIYVLKTEFNITYKELMKITGRSMDTLTRHNNELYTIEKLYEVPNKLVTEIHDYITNTILQYIEDGCYV